MSQGGSGDSGVLRDRERGATVRLSREGIEAVDVPHSLAGADIRM